MCLHLLTDGDVADGREGGGGHRVGRQGRQGDLCVQGARWRQDQQFGVFEGDLNPTLGFEPRDLDPVIFS